MERVVALGNNVLHGKESKEKKPSIWRRYSHDKVIFIFILVHVVGKFEKIWFFEAPFLDKEIENLKRGWDVVDFFYYYYF